MQNSSARSTPSEALHHVRKMGKRLEDTIRHLREDIERVQEPQFKALFETTAEVLNGLVTAFRHYEQKSEGAWRGAQPGDPRATGITQDQRGQDQPLDKKTAQR